MLRSRRAVGGLISLVALIIVFGVIALVMIDLNLTQALFFQEQNKISNKLHDRNLESLSFEVLDCTPRNETHFDTIEIRINNTSPQDSKLESIFFLNDTIDRNSMASTHYVFTNRTLGDNNVYYTDNGLDLPIVKSISSEVFTIQNYTQFAVINQTDDTIIKNSTKVMIVTNLGNKIIDAFDFTNECNSP